MHKYSLSLVLIIFFFPAYQLFAEPLLLVTDNTPGGNYITGDGTTFDDERPGIEIELYKMVAEKLNLQLTLKRMPWKLCLQQLEYNKVDGIFPASFNIDRMKTGHYPMKGGLVDPSRKTRNNAYYLYTMRGSPLSWNGSDFNGLSGSIGVPQGWAIAEELKNKGVPIKELPLHNKTPDLLVLKRLQGFICLETVFDYYLEHEPKNKYKNIVKEKLPIWKKPYYLMLSRQFVEKEPETAENIWNAIKEIKKTEAFSRLVNKYLK